MRLDRRISKFLFAGAIVIELFGIAIVLRGQQLLQFLRGRPIHAASGLAVFRPLSWLIWALLSAITVSWWAAGASFRRLDESDDAAAEISEGEAGSRFPAVALFLVLALAAAAGWVMIGRSFGYDEARAMVENVQAPGLDGLRGHLFQNHLSATLLAKLSVAIFGAAERGARAGAFAVTLAGLAALAALVWIVTRDRVAVIWATAYLAASPMILHESYQIRGYSFLFWASTGIVALLLARPRLPGRAAQQAGLAGASFLLLGLALGLSHLFGFLCVVILALALSLRLPGGWPIRWKDRERETVALCLGALAISATISLLPLLSQMPWIFYFRSPGSGGIGELASLAPLATDLAALLAPLPVGLLVCLVFIVCHRFVWSRFPGSTRLIVLGTAATFLMLAISLLRSRPVFLYPRFVGWCLPWSAAAAAIAFAAVRTSRAPWKRWAASTAQLGLLAANAPGFVLLMRPTVGIRETVEAEVKELRRLDSPAARLLHFDTEQDRAYSVYVPKALSLTIRNDGDVRERLRLGAHDVLITYDNDRDSNWIREAGSWPAIRSRFLLEPIDPGRAFASKFHAWKILGESPAPL